MASLLLGVSASVWAADTDGDGVDDAVDAFPNDGCATTDTDNDGLADVLEPKGNCLIDGFETGNLTGAGNAWVTSAGYPWVVATGGRTGNYAARQDTGYLVVYPFLRLSYSVAAPTTLIFYYRSGRIGVGASFKIDGVKIGSELQGNWTRRTAVLTNGSHTLQWESYTCDWAGCPETEVWIDDIGRTTLVEDNNDDNDAVLDASDKFPLDSTEWLDTDNDTIGNNADWDDDNDGVPDTVDAAPLNAANTSEITLPLDSNYKGLQLKGKQNAIH